MPVRDVPRGVVHEQADAEKSRARLERFRVRDEHRDGLASARNHDALTFEHPLEQL